MNKQKPTQQENARWQWKPILSSLTVLAALVASPAVAQEALVPAQCAALNPSSDAAVPAAIIYIHAPSDSAAATFCLRLAAENGWQLTDFVPIDLSPTGFACTVQNLDLGAVYEVRYGTHASATAAAQAWALATCDQTATHFGNPTILREPLWLWPLSPALADQP